MVEDAVCCWRVVCDRLWMVEYAVCCWGVVYDRLRMVEDAVCCWGVVCDRLRMVEDAVPGKQLNEMEERRQELIGKSLRVFDSPCSLR